MFGFKSYNSIKYILYVFICEETAMKIERRFKKKKFKQLQINFKAHFLCFTLKTAFGELSFKLIG